MPVIVPMIPPVEYPEYPMPLTIAALVVAVVWILAMLGTVRLVGQVLSCAIVTLLLSLRWDAPAEESLLHSIELSFVVFAVLCVLGIVPSLARRAAKSAPPEER